MRIISSGSALTVFTLIALLASGGGDIKANADVRADHSGRVCFQPYPETEEQFIQRHFTQAFAVFSGKVSAMTVETARITVTRVWKGKLGAEVAMPTGTREMGNNVIMISGESFSFQTGEDYLIFGHGTSAETLSTSVCVPTGRLADSKRKIAVLDQIVARAGGSTAETRR